MLSSGAKAALIDIAFNIAAARSFIGSLSFQRFKDDLKTLYAVTRALEIISEASRRLPDDLKARHGHMDWRAMRGAGNIYRHEYDSVAASFIWKTVHESLSPLLMLVEQELEAADRN